jgi:lambda family phage portal protein
MFAKLRSWLGGDTARIAEANATVAKARAKTAAANSAIKARYDNSLTTDENKRNWWAADYLSAKSANSFGVRRVLRMRSRYEVSNNPILFGVVNSNADDLIDTGPTLQVTTPDAAYNREVEACWRTWCEEVEYGEKLRTLKLAKTVDGEGFLVLKTVRDMEHPVKLYPCDLEADQITTPMPTSLQEFWIDGLTLHPITGRPVSYHVLRSHPGDYFFPTLNPMAVDKYAARFVIHWFPKFRPGQVRGIPVFSPSLDLFTELRAYRRAVLGCAEVAADYTAIIQQSERTGTGGDPTDADQEWEPFKSLPIDRRQMAFLPAGATISQLRSEQPTTTYDSFQEKCLSEACRPLNYPLNLALGTSQKFNFSSAKLDHINYRNGLRVERDHCDAIANSKMFREWYTEAVLVGAIRQFKDPYTPPPHEWHWPGFEPLDASVDSKADADRLAAGTMTYREFWARRGYDWKDVYAQLAAEQKERGRLDLEFGEPAKKTIRDDEAKPNSAEARWRNLFRAFRAFDESKVKRDEGGKFDETGGSARTAQKKPSAKAARAKASHHLVDSKIQRYAEEHNEPQFAKAIGGLSFKDNEPVDVVLGKGGVIQHGVELKTMVSNKAAKITMKKSAMERKAAWEKANKATFHTVVIDDSAVFNANGEGKHDESKRVIYYRRGYGSFRVAGMHKAKDHAELKKLMNTPNEKLPDAAKRTESRAAKSAK